MIALMVITGPSDITHFCLVVFFCLRLEYKRATQENKQIVRLSSIHSLAQDVKENTKYIVKN